MLGKKEACAGVLVALAPLYVEVVVAEPAEPKAPVPVPAAEVPPAAVSSALPATPPAATRATATPAAPPTPPAPGKAWIHVSADYRDAWLEGRSRLEDEPWHPLCAAPCDQDVVVEGLDVRVTAPRMTASNAFTIEPGVGAARLRVSGGSASARSWGLVGLAGGLPITFAGVTLLGVGAIHSEPGERTAGIVTLAIGAAAVLAALPLLVSGSTSVKSSEGRRIALPTKTVAAF